MPGHVGAVRAHPEAIQACAEGVRQQAVVGVEEDQVLAVTFADAGIARGGQPGIGLAQVADPGYRATTPATSSSEPSSMTMTSRLVWVCASALSIASPRYRAWL